MCDMYVVLSAGGMAVIVWETTANIFCVSIDRYWCSAPLLRLSDI